MVEVLLIRANAPWTQLDFLTPMTPQMEGLPCVSRLYQSSHSEDSESAKPFLGQKCANWDTRHGNPAKPSHAPRWATPGAMEPSSFPTQTPLTSPPFVHQVGAVGELSFQVLDHLACIF